MAQKRVKKYDYIKRSDISVLKATVDGKVLNVDPKKILSGTYVAGKITPTAKKLRVAKIDPFKLKEKIIAKAKEVMELKDVQEVEPFVLAKDLKAFIECGLTEEMIMAFYLGFKAVVEVMAQGEYADYGDSGGIFGYRTDGGYIERAIERAIYNCENKCFELGFKYPDFNWKKAGMKVSKTEVVTTPEYEFMGKNRKDVLKVETFKVKTNFTVLAVKNEATLMEGKVAVVDPKVPLELNGGYLALVSRNAKDLFALAKKLLGQSESYVKDFDWLIQTKTDGAKSLNDSGVKYAKGGFIMPVENLTNKYSYLKRDLSNIKGDVEVRIEKRNLKGLSGSQDPFDMIIYQKNKKIATFGTHPSQKGAEKMLKNLKGGSTYSKGGEVRVLKDIDGTYHKDYPKKGDILIVRDLERDINYWETEDEKKPESVTAWYKGRGNEYMLGEEVEFIDNGKLASTYFAEGGEIEYNYFEVENDKNGETITTYARTNVASPNIPNAKKISKQEYEKNIYAEGGRIETLTRLNGNRQEYTLPLPKIVVLSRNINDVALDWIRQNTGLNLKKTAWAYEAQPKTSAQIVKLLTMSGTPLIQFQNNATNKNVLFMKYYRDDFLQYKKGGEVEKANMGMLLAAEKAKGLAPKTFDAADTKIANRVSKKSFAERMSETGNEEMDSDTYAEGGEVYTEYPHYVENGFRDKAELRKELEYLIQSIYDTKKYINQSKAYSKRAYTQRGTKRNNYNREMIERSAAFWDNERAQENEALRRARSNYEDAFGEKKYVPFMERFAKGGSLGDARYIPQHQLLNVKLKNGKVIENSFNNPIYSGLRIGEAINEQEEMEAMGQMRLFKQGGRMPKYATYISARDIDTVYFGDEDDPKEVRGSELKNGIWYDNESGARLVEFAKSKGYLK
jgi:hypothetical protein